MEIFPGSTGWLAKFKEKYALTFKSICGKSGSLDEKIVKEWRGQLNILDG